MNPLGLAELNWDDYRSRPVAEAHGHLLALADRPVYLHNRSIAPGVRKSFRTSWSGGIHIFIDLESPTRDHTFVHELLHEILIAERYVEIANIPKELRDLREVLTNEMQHPEIFRRMEEVYKLDMEAYWADWREEMEQAVATLKEESRHRDYWIDLFPRVYTWFFQKVSVPYLPECDSCCPILFQGVLNAAEATRPIGFSTAEDHRRSIELFREHWLRFCERNLPRSYNVPPPHTVIEQSTIRPMIERERSVPAKDLMTLLRNKGFRAS